MYSTFEKLSEDKKQKIIKVCIEEFIKKGYEGASTDIITEKAGISKGSLFYYFKNKKNLYFYLANYTYHLIFEEVMEAVEEIKEQDFFERIKKIVLAKQKITIHYYNETLFLMSALSNPPMVLKKECEDIYKNNWKAYEGMKDHVYMTELIHPECLRDSVSIDTAVNFTIAIFESFSERYFRLYSMKQIDLSKYYEIIIKELNEYIDIIKHGIYKRKIDDAGK